MPLLPVLALLALALAEPAAPHAARSIDEMPAGAIVDKGRIVSSQHVMWRPRGDFGQAYEGYIYEFQRADGSTQKMAERDAQDLPKGTEVYVVSGPRLTLVNAKTYVPPAPPKVDASMPVGAAGSARTASAAGAGSTVSPVTVKGRKPFMTISEARDNAVGDDWKKVYCETGTTLGSRVPRQTCLPLREWDIRHQEMENIREMMRSWGEPGQSLNGAG